MLYQISFLVANPKTRDTMGVVVLLYAREASWMEPFSKLSLAYEKEGARVNWDSIEITPLKDEYIILSGQSPELIHGPVFPILGQDHRQGVGVDMPSE